MSDLSALISIGLVQIVAVISPGPSFLITARTSVAKSRSDGIKVALGLAPKVVEWRRMRPRRSSGIARPPVRVWLHLKCRRA